jgi:predicted regulator of Ras-like GTPase activity (Roadblock/LC7/MglB family)
MMAAARISEPSADDAARDKLLRPVLRTLNGVSPDIEASAVITSDGLTIAAVMSDGVDRDRFGAMCASLLALADRAAQEISRGQLKQVLVEGEHGTMLLVQAGNDTVLAVASRPTQNLGMVFLEARRAAQKVRETLAMVGN